MYSVKNSNIANDNSFSSVKIGEIAKKPYWFDQIFIKYFQILCTNKNITQNSTPTSTEAQHINWKALKAYGCYQNEAEICIDRNHAGCLASTGITLLQQMGDPAVHLSNTSVSQNTSQPDLKTHCAPNFEIPKEQALEGCRQIYKNVDKKEDLVRTLVTALHECMNSKLAHAGRPLPNTAENAIHDTELPPQGDNSPESNDATLAENLSDISSTEEDPAVSSPRTHSSGAENGPQTESSDVGSAEIKSFDEILRTSCDDLFRVKSYGAAVTQQEDSSGIPSSRGDAESSAETSAPLVVSVDGDLRRDLERQESASAASSSETHLEASGSALGEHAWHENSSEQKRCASDHEQPHAYGISPDKALPESHYHKGDSCNENTGHETRSTVSRSEQQTETCHYQEMNSSSALFPVASRSSGCYVAHENQFTAQGSKNQKESSDHREQTTSRVSPETTLLAASVVAENRGEPQACPESCLLNTEPDNRGETSVRKNIHYSQNPRDTVLLDAISDGEDSREPQAGQDAQLVDSFSRNQRETPGSEVQRLSRDKALPNDVMQAPCRDHRLLKLQPIPSRSEKHREAYDRDEYNSSEKSRDTAFPNVISVDGDFSEQHACHTVQPAASCSETQTKVSDHDEVFSSSAYPHTLSNAASLLGNSNEQACSERQDSCAADEKDISDDEQTSFGASNKTVFLKGAFVVGNSHEADKGYKTRSTALRSEHLKQPFDHSDHVSSGALPETALPIARPLAGGPGEESGCHETDPMGPRSENEKANFGHKRQQSSRTASRSILPDGKGSMPFQGGIRKVTFPSNKLVHRGRGAPTDNTATDADIQLTMKSSLLQRPLSACRSKVTSGDKLNSANGELSVKAGVACTVRTKTIFRFEDEGSNNNKEQAVAMSFAEKDFAARGPKLGRVPDHMIVFCDLRKVHSVLSSKCDDYFDCDLPKQAALDYVQHAARDVIKVQAFPLGLNYLFLEIYSELWRLSTFSLLVDLIVSPIRLAQSGFYYAQDRNVIQCFSCGVKKRNWDESEKRVALVHLQISPDCDQANFRDTRNIPIDGQQIQALGTREGPDHTRRVYVQSSSQIQSPAQCETDSDSVTSSGPPSGPVQVGQTSAPRKATAFSATKSRSEGGRNSSIEAGNLSLPTPPQDLELIAKHREYAAQSAGTAAPSSSVSPNLSKSGVVLGTDNASSLVSNNSLTFTTSQVPTRTASGEGPEYIRFSVQVTQSSGSQASVPQTSSSAHGGNGGQDACDSATTVQFDDAVLTSLDMNRAASPLNAKTRSRFLSFAGWPRNSGLSPTVLAEAGFYYLGSGDSVRCWYCGIILRNWRQSDDPWVTHVLFRFSCDFVLAVRGQNFITQALIHRRQARNTQREDEPARFAGTTNGQSGSQAPRSANGTPEEQVRYGISEESPTTHLSATTSQRQPSCQDTANGTSNNTFNVDDASNKMSGVNTQDNRRTSAASAAAPNTTRSSEPDSASGRPEGQSTVVTSGGGRLDGAQNERSSRDSRERRSNPDPSSVAGRGNAVSRGPGLSTDAATSSTSNSRPAAGSSSSIPSSVAGASNTGRSASSSRNSSASEPSSGASATTKSGSASGKNNVGEKRKSKSNKGSKKGTGNGETTSSKKTGAANVTPGQHAPQQELQTDAVPIAGDAAHARRAQASVAAADAVRPGVTGMAARQEVRESNTTSERQQSSITPEQNGCTPLTGAITRNQSMSAEDAEQYYQRLVQDNRRLRERRTCKICRRNVIDTIFLPCGHLCTCDTCSSTIRECCLCYQRIRGTAHVYME